MAYSGASTAAEAKQALSEALQALQSDSDIPAEVMAVASNIAAAVGALYEAENASSEIDGKGCVKHAMQTMSQTLALLQDVRAQHQGIEVASKTIANAMSRLFALTTVPSKPPPEGTAPVPRVRKASSGVIPGGPPVDVEANIGANTETNFFVGFSGEISEGGVFIATYTTLPKRTRVNLQLSLPGGFETQVGGSVLFVRDPMDLSSESEPGIGVKFDSIDEAQRQLMLRFIKKRPPIFYDE